MARFAGTGAKMQRVGRGVLERKVPGLRPGWTDGVWLTGCADIDVAALHAHYLARARGDGAELRVNAEVGAIARKNDEWMIALPDGTLTARVIVNAAGAWADACAVAAGADPIGIAPMRRTVVQVRTTPVQDAAMPLVLDIGGAFYFKPGLRCDLAQPA